MKIKWPTGKYNGRRISGFKVSFAVHLLWFKLIPLVSFGNGQPFFIWLWFSIRACPEYEWEDPE